FPGAQTEKFVYDALDRLVASGPYPSPFLGETAVGWIHTKYDALNRPAYSLWVAGANCSLSENYYLSGNYDVSESRSSGRSINGVSVGYTNSVAPASGEVLQVYYYDDYHYPDAPSSIPSTIKGQAVFFNKTNAPKGLPTSTWTRVLEARSKKRGEQTAFLYDVNQRVIAELTTHYQGGSTDVHSLFDFAGNVLETETLHKQNANAEVLSVSEAFSYAFDSYLLQHTHRINNGTRHTLFKNTYDAFGQTIKQQVGGVISLNSSEFLQQVDYNYNIRGWLTDINNISQLKAPNQPQDLFA